ncbi:MAG TPA: T9SS type A sorting domain-containing protein, partial [Candidatus Kapabacteria bacterium]
PGDHQHILGVGNIKPNPVPAGITTTSMDYRLKAESTVTITINDQLGNIVKTVADGTSAAGEHVVSLDLTGLTSGGYLVRVQAGTDVQTRRLIIQ